MTSILRGKVIKFIEGNDYKIIVNIGVEKGIRVGMPFIVYYEGDKVIDPDTQEDLGKLEYIKAKLKVSQVAEKYSILESDEFIIQRPSFLEILMEDQGRRRRLDRVQKALKLARVSPSPEKSKEEIVIGDLVRSDPSRE